MSKWNVAAYLRLSSDDGDKAESNSIGNQRSIINQYVKQNKELKNVEYYIDDGYSGTTFDRPDFNRMIDDIRKNNINCIILKDLSRFGRNYIEVGKYFDMILPNYNVRIIAINDNIDSFKDPNSINNVIVPFKNLMNDEYARDISNKVRSVLDNKKASGQFIGSTAPYGYLRDPNDKHKFIIDKKAAKVVRKIFDMILDGKSRKEVATELNELNILPPALYKNEESNYNYEIKDNTKLWNNKKLNKILKNRSYVGDLVQGKRKRISHKIKKTLDLSEEEWIVFPNHHKAIISEDDFNRVQDIIYDRTIRVKKNNELDLFSGHLCCNECGNSLILKKAKGYEYYYCSSYLKRKECTNHACQKKTLEKDILDIINNYKLLIKDIDLRINEIVSQKEINYDLEILNSRISDCDSKINKYVLLRDSIKEDLNEKFISEQEYWEYSDEYSKKIKELKNKRKEYQNKIKNISFMSETNKDWINTFCVDKQIKELNKKIIDELIDDIVIDKNKNIRIIFKYEDKYFEALDFINKHKCDIISAS
ncbi:MAG: recombinase family protein [Candidatus Coprovivens sp.]